VGEKPRSLGLVIGIVNFMVYGGDLACGLEMQICAVTLPRPEQACVCQEIVGLGDRPWVEETQELVPFTVHCCNYRSTPQYGCLRAVQGGRTESL
jgi:hypothetical protein